MISIHVPKSNTASVSWSYLLKEVVLILVFLYLFLFNGTAADFVNEPILKITFGLLTVVGLAWIIAGQRAPTPLAKPLLLFLGVYFLACLTSIDPRRSIEDFGWLVFIVFLFAISADLVAHGWPAELIIKSLIVSGGLILAFVWYDPITWYLRWLEAAPGEWIPSVVYRPPSANTLAMFLNTYLMITLARLVASKSKVNRVIFGALVTATFGMLYLTSSRAGWLGTIGGLAVMALLLFLAQMFDPRPVWRWLKAGPARMIATGLALFIFLTPVVWLLYRQTLHPSHGPLFTSRQQFWGPAITTFLEHPLLGQGPYTFSSSLLRARTLGDGQIFVHAHSTPLNLLAETGIFGLLTALLLAFTLFKWMYQRWTDVANRKESREFSVVMGAFAALSAYFVHGLADAFQAEPIGLWLLALVVGSATGKVKIGAPRSWYFRPWWAVALIAAAWFNYWLMEPLFRGVEALNNDQWQEATVQFRLATQRDPLMASNWNQLGLSQSILIEESRSVTVNDAIISFEKAVELDPDWFINYFNLGLLYRKTGDLDKARYYLEEVLTRTPNISLAQLVYGIILDEQGNTKASKQAVFRTIEQWPFEKTATIRTDATFQTQVEKIWVEYLLANKESGYIVEFNGQDTIPTIIPGEPTTTYYTIVAFRRMASFIEVVPQVVNAYH